MWLSYLLIALIAASLVAVVAVGIRNRRAGKHACSCGGNCGACHLCGAKESKK